MRRLLGALCLVTVLCSCTNEEEEDNNTALESSRERVYATFEQPDTRTYIDDAIRWHEGDALSLFRGVDINTRYLFEGNTGDREGSFVLADIDIVGGQELEHSYALYPYDYTTSITAEGRISYTLPAAQEYAECSFGRGSNVMMAMAAPKSDSFSFKNCGGYLRLQLYGTDVTLRNIALRGNGGEPLSGDAIITATEEGLPNMIMDVRSSTTLSLDCGEGVTISNDPARPTEFWLVLPPTLFTEGFTITLTDNTGREVTHSTSKRVAIERNVIRPMAAIEVSFLGNEGEQTFSAISGSWKLNEWRGTTPNFEVYLEIEEDGSVALWQKIAIREWSHYTSSATLEGDTISGVYSDGIAWSTSYNIALEEDTMTWTSSSDANDISLYVRATLPEELAATRGIGDSDELRFL